MTGIDQNSLSYEEFAQQVKDWPGALGYLEALSLSEWSQRAPELGETMDMPLYGHYVRAAAEKRALLNPAHAQAIDNFIRAKGTPAR